MSLGLVLALGVLLSITIIALVGVKDLFTTILLLSVLSAFNVALLAVLGAVDVAFMEAVVGVAVSTIFFMALIRRIDPHRVLRRRVRSRWLGLFVSLATAGLLLYVVDALPAFGDPAAPASVHVSPEYVTGAIPQVATPNVVTAVLGDYRGFDTLIETCVVMTAAMACLLVLGRKP